MVDVERMAMARVRVMGQQVAASAVNRFGLGARPGELAQVSGDPRGWLHAQIGSDAAGAAFAGLPASAEYLARYYEVLRMRREARDRQSQAGDPMRAENQAQPMAGRRGLRAQQISEVMLRQAVAVRSDRSFSERIVRFWSNHFAISVDKLIAASFAAPMEREAIRPHAFGRFADLLLAVERHPGMLLYLDNAQSIGDDSRLAEQAQRRARRNPGARRRGLNENLAREILELHTLGVDAGYTQADVQELAKAITGWSVPSPRDGGLRQSGDAFVFRAMAHEPGSRRVLGKSYAAAGQAQGQAQGEAQSEAQGEAVLRDLAVHPATAHHLAFKLARHFVADVPPPALVARMAAAYLRADGDLPALYRALIDDDAAWSADARKFKSPDDFMVSALRGCGLDANADLGFAMRLQAQLGQPMFQPRSPAGFGDTAADWGGPDALYKRVQTAQALAERATAMAPLAFGQAALGPALDADTATALRRAESMQQGMALLLASPVFQWRT
jgi:uncharacterized protein (DUF1800 family)